MSDKLLLLLMLLDQQLYQIKVREIHRGKGLIIRLSFSVALSTIQVTVRFSQFRGKTLCGWSEASREDLRLSSCLRVPPCRKGTIHLQTSMPSAGFELGSYGTAVSVTNHYIGWVASYS
ncbi:hypothetical protein TNCV_1959821 [Trichonephila clavipes]|nr:hypothetical protein TNCV_1959821 [Trichonephila clavipes]